MSPPSADESSLPGSNKIKRIIKNMLGRMRKKKELYADLKDLGFSKKQIKQMGNTDDDSVLEDISIAQSVKKEELGLNNPLFQPVIGHHIKWIDVVSMAFRVNDFYRTSTIITEDGQVIAQSETQPYGYLLVESPTLIQPVILPITHRDDFLLADSVYGDESVMSYLNNGERELLVTYSPKKIKRDGRAATPHRMLHYAFVPKGTLERYYSNDDIGNRRMAKPEPQLLFGPFKYKGMIQVYLNLSPHI